MSDPSVLRAAQAAAQAIQSQGQPPAAQPAPQPPAAPPPPQGGGQPPAPPPSGPPPAQQPAYVPPTGIARAIINGKPIDVPVAELVAKYQMGTVTEQRMAEVNALRNEHRQALETQARLATLARTNPQAFQEEAHKAFGLRPAPQAENSLSARIDPNEAPETTALRQEIAQLRAGFDELNQFRGHVVMQNVATQIRGAIQQFPLYQQNSVAAQRAETTAATYLANNPGASPVEVIGMVHAQDQEFLQSTQQQTRDQRAAAVQQFASVPPGTPQLSHADIPKMSEQQMRGKSLSAMKSVAADLKARFGL